MTRREHLEAKLDKRQEWAGKASARSETAFEKAGDLADRIPMGQPILVGHHSERHARADAERIRNGMDRGVQEYKLAEHHATKAAGLERQLDHSIYSDDDNALDALRERIAKREAQAAGMVAMNAAWRKSKGDVALFARLAGINDGAAEIVASGIRSAYSWEASPYPAWELGNLRGNIRRDRERLAEIERQAERTAQAEANGGIVVQEVGEYCRVTFAEKPDRSVLDSLRAAGFQWGGGSWAGKTASLPDGLR